MVDHFWYSVRGGSDSGSRAFDVQIRFCERSVADLGRGVHRAFFKCDTDSIQGKLREK